MIDGYDLWEFAKELKRPILQCIEYDLSETEALEWLLQRQHRSAGLNHYSRIMLAELVFYISYTSRDDKNMVNETERMVITRVFDAPRELVWKAWTDRNT